MLAGHYTPIRGRLKATVVETVHFERPDNIPFRLACGPVPHVAETFTLERHDDRTHLAYTGELGTDLWGLGERWGDIVAPTWVSVVRSSFHAVKTEAERRQLVGDRRGSNLHRARWRSFASYSHRVFTGCIVRVMSASQALLGLLETEPAHGYTLKQRYDRHFSRVKPLPFGQVYASLSRFQRDGLAAVSGTEGGDGPDRILYAITADGVSAVGAWIHQAEPPTTYASSTLLTKVTLALLSGRDAGRVLDSQRVVHLRRMRELTRARHGAPAPELLALTHELAHLDADLRWIEEAGARLEELRVDLTGDSA